ncbi:MAG: HEPN domain-containing protein [bacterium]
MIEIVKKWIIKAENDFKAGMDEMNTENPATDTICFHMQQFAEKYLKAYLTFNKKHFGKTHNIAELIELCKELDPEFDSLYQLNTNKLTRYATEFRYPDDFYIPTIEETQEAIDIAIKTKKFVMGKLKMSNELNY